MASTLDRGFKAWAERTSLALRREFELASDAPLQPYLLASHLGIALWTPRDVPGLPEDVLNQLLHEDPWGWSAVSLQVDGKGIVIYNPKKSKGRKSSDIMHELAHIMLDHRPATIILSSDLGIAMRSYDPKQEDEANWLAWCLLLPREALVSAKRRGLSATQIAEYYDVTKTLVDFRNQKTGINAQFKVRKRRTHSAKS